MPHLSKKKVEKEIFERILIQLVGSFKMAGKRELLPDFLDELLTPVEKIMMSKRLAAIILLDKGMPQHLITDKLQMSPSTIAKLSLRIERGDFNKVLSIMKSSKQAVSQMLIELLAAGSTAALGRSRRYFGSMYKDSSPGPHREGAILKKKQKK